MLRNIEYVFWGSKWFCFIFNNLYTPEVTKPSRITPLYQVTKSDSEIALCDVSLTNTMLSKATCKAKISDNYRIYGMITFTPRFELYRKGLRGRFLQRVSWQEDT